MGTAAVRQVAALQPLPQRRWTTYASVVNFPREEISERLTLLEDAVLGVNWGDYFILIQDQPFWEAELDQLDHYCQPYLSDPEIGPKLQRVHRMFDCLAQLEDCRDYMNEIGEVMTLRQHAPLQLLSAPRQSDVPLYTYALHPRTF